MAVTINRPVQIDRYTWLVTYSSSLSDPTFYIWLNGQLVSTTKSTEYRVTVVGSSSPVLDIFDDAASQPEASAQGFFEVMWTLPAAAVQVKVERQAAGSGSWSEIGTFDVIQGTAKFRFTTEYLDDKTGYIYAATAIDAAGRESEREMAHFPMVRIPDVPAVSMSYDNGTRQVTISSSLTPGENTFALYRGEDTEVDYSSFWEEIDSFPHVTAALSLDTLTRLTVRQTNPWMRESANDNPTEFNVGPAGTLVTPPPSAPEDITITAISSGKVKLEAQYMAALDGYVRPATTGNAADTWVIWLTSDGSDPDPADTPTATEAMKLPAGWAKLEYESAAFTNGATIKALVRVRRTSDSVDSTNTGIVSTTADTSAATSPTLDRTNTGFGQGNEANIAGLYQDANNRVALLNWDAETKSPALRFYLGGVLVMQVDLDGVKLRGGVFVGNTVDGTAMSAGIEWASGYWYFGAGSSLTRRWILTAAGNLYIPGSAVAMGENYPYNLDSLPDSYATNWQVISSGDAANDLILSPDLSRANVIFRDNDNNVYAPGFEAGAII